MTIIKQGLNLPISGAPEQRIDIAKPARRVALLGDDYVGMKPTMLVGPGDRVKLGQAIFEDKKTAGVTYTSPASGTPRQRGGDSDGKSHRPVDLALCNGRGSSWPRGSLEAEVISRCMMLLSRSGDLRFPCSRLPVPSPRS